MYDFTLQKNMLRVSLELLKEKNIENISALGGGTALAGFYWKHRYSTDIDIFIYSETKNIDNLRPNLWSRNIKEQMMAIGYKDDFKINPIYTEFAINEDSKIQFFDVTNYTDNPYKKIKFWDMEFNIESINEIIAKKIDYRCEKGNARDIFDISLAIHKQADILKNLKLNHKRIIVLYETVINIKNDDSLLTQYKKEIKEINPAEEYNLIAFNAIEYLSLFLENYLSAYNMGIELEKEEFEIIESAILINIKNNYIKA